MIYEFIICATKLKLINEQTNNPFGSAEEIITATREDTLNKINELKKMGNDIYEKYEGKIKCFYAARKFGNAVDTRDREFIRKEYLEMQKQNFYIPFKTKLLYIKSTNRILKSIVDKVKGR